MGVVTRELVVQDGEKAAMDRQPGFAVVIDEAAPSEPVHEQVDPRSSRADHLRQVLLIDAGDDGFTGAVLAEV